MSRIERGALSSGSKRVILGVLLAVISMIASGCPDRCLYDTDCDGARVCVGGVCSDIDTSLMESGECRKDLDCDRREHCKDGICVLRPDPVDPLSCETDEDCDPPATICGEIERCEPGCTPEDCDAGSYCGPGGRCIEGCATDEHCELGSWCGPLGSCLEGCGRDSHCEPPETVCDEDLGECVPGCEEGDCGVGEYCSDESGRCEEGCYLDLHCDPPDLVCEEGECVPGCVETGCPTGMRCDSLSGRCGEGCDDDSNCAPPDTVCGPGGTCVDGCLMTGCGFEEHCEEESGRCASGCRQDDHCAPPGSICDAEGACVAGCLETGCGFEEYCVTDTGRCTSGCLDDSHCGVPDTVCEGGSCVAGCLTTGCGFEEYCVGEAGRCATGCRADSDCGPPDTICSPEYTCVHGCLTTGCGFDEYCGLETGRCLPGCMKDSDCAPPDFVCGEDSFCVEGCMTADFCPEGLLCRPEDGLCEEPGDVALGMSCSDGAGGWDHKLCETDYCLSLDPPFCSRPCSSTMEHCPEPGALCFYGLSPPGAGVCFTYGSPETPPGEPCSVDTDCKSWECLGGTCADTCQHDRDCGIDGQVCRLVLEKSPPRFLCAEPAGGQGSSGAACTSHADCRGGFCLANVCADPCHTSPDCPANMFCAPVRHLEGEDVIGLRVCKSDGRTPGSAGVGETCNRFTDYPCRSLWCHRFDDEDRCIDTCGGPDDCPAGFRCIIATVTFGTEGQLLVPLCFMR